MQPRIHVHAVFWIFWMVFDVFDDFFLKYWVKINFYKFFLLVQYDAKLQNHQKRLLLETFQNAISLIGYGACLRQTKIEAL